MALRSGRLLAIARKEVLQLRRDTRSLLMAFMMPALMIVFFGYIISFDVKDIKLAVLDQDHTRQSRELVESFVSAGRFHITAPLTSAAEMAPLLDRGAVRMVLVVPPGFARELTAGRQADVQAIVDGADANTAAISLNYASAIIGSYSSAIALRSTRQATPVTAEARVWYNETLESPPMIVPGLIAVIMMIIAAMLTALTVAREWERGTMEQLAATPVHRAEVILGKLLPYLGIGLVDVIAAVIIGMTVFDVPFRGSPLLLAIMSTMFLIGSLGLGIFISAALKSQLLATQLAMIGTFLPSLLLSGLMFDINMMPRPLQAFSLLVPARYFITVMRGIFLKDVGIPVLYGQGLAMVLYSIIGLVLAIRAFRKEIE
ncbi:MAG: ABC transporter permease [Gemmatimonadetes bacterium]|nr:ABC transporter permease [Gemmatimonadota bacterium]